MVGMPKNEVSGEFGEWEVAGHSPVEASTPEAMSNAKMSASLPFAQQTSWK